MRIFTLAFLLSFIGWSSFAQQTETIIPPSPDAVAFAMYGNVPVSTYTGIPSISVPVYNLQYRDISIPIDLTYMSSGVTLEMEASWVGLGWTLNYGGVITRTVRGGDDLQTVHDGYSDLGNMEYAGYPYDVEPDSASVDDRIKICETKIDPEPDIFYFNFLGRSGRFVLPRGQDRASNFIEGAPLVADKIDIKYDKNGTHWQIRTADGYTFYFGTEEVTETLHASTNYGKGPETMTFDPTTKGFYTYDDIVVSAWYLDKIVSPLGEEAVYKYDVKETIRNGQATGNIYSEYGSARISIADLKRTDMHMLDDYCTTPAPASSSKIFTKHVYLSEIQCGFGKIVFDKSLRDDMMLANSNDSYIPYLSQTPFVVWNNTKGPQKLDAISVINDDGTIVKKVEFVYDYFNSHETGIHRYNFRRLRLDKFRECGRSECKPYHQFFYDTRYNLPSKYSNAQDFWGYYNGAHNNISKIPFGFYYNWQTTGLFYQVGDSDRQPNANYMTTGTLTKIVYPTGGSTSFEFEPNEYYRFGNGAFQLTSFENYQPDPVGFVYNNGSTAAAKTFQFVATEPIQEVYFDEEMTYYPLANATNECNAPNPWSKYDGVKWYTVKNLSTSEEKSVRMMDGYVDYFINNYNQYCAQQPQSPHYMSGLYQDRHKLTLYAGIYEVTVYSREDFNLSVTISRNYIRQRTIPLRSDSVYTKTAGGLRIKRITTLDAIESVPQVKRYDYTADMGSGYKKSTGLLQIYPSNHVPYYCSFHLPSKFIVSILGRSWSHYPLASSASGGIVGYDRVTEYHGENGENGWIEYRYVNEREKETYNPDLIEGFPTKERTENGLLSTVNYFDKRGDKVKTEEYTYTAQMEHAYKGLAYKRITHMWQTNPPSPIVTCQGATMLTRYYTIKSDRRVKATKAVSEYSAGVKTTTSSINYVYDSQTHLQLKSEETSNSDGTSLKTLYLYPPDASWIPSTMWEGGYIFDKVVEKKILRNNELSISDKIYYSAHANRFLVDKIERSHAVGPIILTSSYRYANSGNIRSIKGRNGIEKVYVWSYKHAYPIAEVTNATTDAVLAALGMDEESLTATEGHALPESAFLQKIDDLREALPDAVIVTYRYDPLVGPRSKVDENGRSMTYQYDSLGRLISISDHEGNIVKAYSYQYKQ